MKHHRINLTGKKVAGLVVLLAAVAGGVYVHREEVKSQAQQKAIAEEIIRLHVIANSDSEEDQALKMEVKEEIVAYLREEMGEANSVSKARQIIQENMPKIEKIAKKKMQEKGYEYSAEAELAQCYFPIKQYGDMTFPAGEYEALRVKLGESEGKNWWCVMYPSLCFVDSTYQVVPDSSKEKLKQSLTAEEYDALLDGGDDIEYSSRIWEWVQNLVE